MQIPPTKTTTIRIDGLKTAILPATPKDGDILWFREGDPGQLSSRKMRGSRQVLIIDANPDSLQATTVCG